MLKQGVKTVQAEFISTCALFQLSFIQFQGLRINLKRVRLRLLFKNLGTCHIQNKNYKKLKNTRAIRVHEMQRMKTFLILGFF